MIKPNMNITFGVYSYIARPYMYVAEYINITKEMIMKILKLTKKQYEVLRCAFMQGADAHLGSLEGGFDWDGNIVDKEQVKKYDAYMRIIKKLEIKLNCLVP